MRKVDLFVPLLTGDPTSKTADIVAYLVGATAANKQSMTEPPTAVRSDHCKFEFDSFLAREKELGRSDLVFPILYIPVPALTGDRWRQDPLLSIIGSRQYEQWQNVRQLDPSSTEVALRVEKFCANICRALEQEWLSPEERQQAEVQRVAEEEHRRQEGEIKQPADDEEHLRKANAEKRRQDEEWHRPEL